MRFENQHDGRMVYEAMRKMGGSTLKLAEWLEIPHTELLRLYRVQYWTARNISLTAEYLNVDLLNVYYPGHDFKLGPVTAPDGECYEARVRIDLFEIPELRMQRKEPEEE